LDRWNIRRVPFSGDGFAIGVRGALPTPSHITIAAHDPEKEHSNCNPSAQWPRVDDDIAHEFSVEVGFDFEVFCLARAL
jgi:hypothetical protein